MGGKSTFIRQVIIFCTNLLEKLIIILFSYDFNFQTLSFYLYAGVKHDRLFWLRYLSLYGHFSPHIQIIIASLVSEVGI